MNPNQIRSLILKDCGSRDSYIGNDRGAIRAQVPRLTIRQASTANNGKQWGWRITRALNLAHSSAAETEAFGDEAAPELAVALHALRIAITIFDSRERLVFANEHFNYLLRSMPPRAILIGRTYEDLVRLELAGQEIDGVSDVEAYIAARAAPSFAKAIYGYRATSGPGADGRLIEIKARRTASGGWIVLWSGRHERPSSPWPAGKRDRASSADAFAFFDFSDRLVMCNTGFAHLHGHDAPDSLVGQMAPPTS